MRTEHDGQVLEVVKWYTRARKFPQLIGRTPDGARLWGGPYTITQAVGAGVLLLVGVNTMGLWARYGLLGNALVLLGVTYSVVLLLGRVPVGSRNPLAVCGGLGRALSAPRSGRLAGRPVKLRRPHQLRHRIVLLTTPPPTPAHRPRPAPAPSRHPTPALSGVQSLLARSTTSPSRLEHC